MSRLRLFGYYLPSLLSVVGRFYRLVARSDKRIVRFARVVARCGVVVNEDSSVNFNRGTAGFPVGILNVDDRIPTVDGIALRFEYTAINLQVSFLRGACRCYQNTRVGNSGSIRTDGEVSVLDRRSALRNTDRCIGPFAAAAAVNGNGAVDNQIGATAIDACNVCGCTVFRSDDEAFSANNHLFARFAHLDALLQFVAFLRCQYRTLFQRQGGGSDRGDIGRIIDSHTARNDGDIAAFQG